MTTGTLPSIESKLMDATKNDALGWPAVNVAELASTGLPEHFWRYLPSELRDLWGELPTSARIVAFMIARERDYFADPPD